jgi:Family of unknown function (DUF6529)
VIQPQAPPFRGGRRTGIWLVAPLLAFALVALTVGVFARAREPSGGTYFDLFFSDTIHMKAWLASGAAALALFQIFSAAWIFGKLPWRRPRWIGRAHRWSGRLAFVLTLPVAYHCIFLLGFADGTARTLSHSLLGAADYGAFASKILIVRLRRFPVWVLPTAGGLLFGTLLAVWYTSALWFFRMAGLEL